MRRWPTVSVATVHACFHLSIPFCHFLRAVCENCTPGQTTASHIHEGAAAVDRLPFVTGSLCTPPPVAAPRMTSGKMSSKESAEKLAPAPAALVEALSASLQSYDKLIESTMSSQNSASMALEAVLTCLQDVHCTAPPVGMREDGTLVQEDAFEQYAQKVIELRKRMHAVSNTLKKAQNRLSSLQTVVTRHEMKSLQQR